MIFINWNINAQSNVRSKVFKSIKKIQGLGVFNDYKAPSDIAEFGLKNLIYGWNYSGKTTLSRLFRVIESKKTNPELPTFKFSIDTDNGLITDENFHESTQVVRVFNSDFILENLNFSGSPFKPILLLGTESEEAQNKIEKCEALSNRVLKKISDSKNSIDTSKKKLDKAKTDAAARIKTTIPLVSFFGSTQLDKELQTVMTTKENYKLSQSELESDLKLARTSDQEQLAPVPEISLEPKINELHLKANALLTKIPNLSNTIEHLVKNPLIEKWVESGISLHNQKNECEFCKGKLESDRLQDIKAHFSKDLTDFKNEIQQLLLNVESAKLSIPERKDVEFYPQFRKQFSVAQKNALNSIETFNLEIQKIANDLENKLAAPFKKITPQTIDLKLADAVVLTTEALNKIIIDSNKVTRSFLTEKATAINNLKLHFAQEFANDINLTGFEEDQKHHERLQNRYSLIADRIKIEILRLKAIISQAQLGRNKINKLIELLLGNESIQISVINDHGQEYFQIKRRDGSIAKHLSEGEKTAIAFSYFLTTLNELQKPNEAIIYIDDPISSLDINHIFQITALIRDSIFIKDAGGWTSKFKQVFFSTHNFEFFSLLREAKPDNKKSKYYLVKRISTKTSDLTNMPKSMFEYASEYHFLFDVLHSFHTAADKTDLKVLMLLPNAIRRFVELYTISKFPGNKDTTVDSRAERIFGAVESRRILKVLHYFSHANNIERIAENNDLICDIEGAVNDLIKLLKEHDPLHMEALCQAITQ